MGLGEHTMTSSKKYAIQRELGRVTSVLSYYDKAELGFMAYLSVELPLFWETDPVRRLFRQEMQ